jgi:hypothetical protein
MCWHLPITPRLKRLFSNQDTAKLMCWHAYERIEDHMLRHHADSPQWRNVNRLMSVDGGDSFGKDPRNIRFALMEWTCSITLVGPCIPAFTIFLHSCAWSGSISYSHY